MPNKMGEPHHIKGKSTNLVIQYSLKWKPRRPDMTGSRVLSPTKPTLLHKINPNLAFTIKRDPFSLVHLIWNTSEDMEGNMPSDDALCSFFDYCPCVSTQIYIINNHMQLMKFVWKTCNLWNLFEKHATSRKFIPCVTDKFLFVKDGALQP